MFPAESAVSVPLDFGTVAVHIAALATIQLSARLVEILAAALAIACILASVAVERTTGWSCAKVLPLSWVVIAAAWLVIVVVVGTDLAVIILLLQSAFTPVSIVRDESAVSVPLGCDTIAVFSATLAIIELSARLVIFVVVVVGRRRRRRG